MMFFDQYNNYLDDLCASHGLKHGYVAFAEGQLFKHYIYKDEGVKTYFLGLVKKPQYHLVAEIVVEPRVQVNSYIGYLAFGDLSVLLLDKAYNDAVVQIAETLKHASTQPAVFTVEHELNVIEVV